MKGLQAYELSFSGLKQGIHAFEFPVEQTFFDWFEADIDFQNYTGLAQVKLNKHSTFMEAEISTKGTVELNCDYTGDPYTENVENTFDLIIKFGEKFNNEDDEILILPQEAYQFNISQYLYENILLSIPLKRVCTECKKANEQEEEEEDFIIGEETPEEEIDPRWEALKKLKK